MQARDPKTQPGWEFGERIRVTPILASINRIRHSAAGVTHIVGRNSRYFHRRYAVQHGVIVLPTVCGNFFAGRGAGANNQAGGNDNAFFGTSAGLNNSVGNGNSFFGRSSGLNNQTGIQNSFVGRSAGQSNTSGSFNSFVGGSAGFANSTGGNNTFLGYSSGLNSLGGSNTFVGSLTGDANTVGNNNTLIGAGANVTLNNLSFATAIGAGVPSARKQRCSSRAVIWFGFPGANTAEFYQTGTIP